MLADQNDRIAKREEARLEQLTHKIHVLKLNQDKLVQESKSAAAHQITQNPV